MARCSIIAVNGRMNQSISPPSLSIIMTTTDRTGSCYPHVNIATAADGIRCKSFSRRNTTTTPILEDDNRVSPRSVTDTTRSSSSRPSFYAPSLAMSSTTSSRLTADPIMTMVAHCRRLPIRCNRRMGGEWMPHDEKESCSLQALQNVYEASTAKMLQRIQSSRHHHHHHHGSHHGVVNWSAVLQDSVALPDDDEDGAGGYSDDPQIFDDDDGENGMVDLGEAIDDAIFELEL